MTKIHVVVADDSAICRAQLRDILEHDKDIVVVGEANDGAAVVELVQHHRPHLVVVDLQMPGVDGLKAIERIMARHPVPILVVTSRPGGRSRDVVFEAIRRGALDLAEKPAGHDREGRARLRAMVRQLSAIPVVRHVGSGRRSAGPPAHPVVQAAMPLPAGRPTIRMIGVAASAGGPAALVAFLKDFQADFPGCFAVVQHLPPGFVDAFGRFLQRQVRLDVCVAREGEAIRAGCVVLAPDHAHLVVRDKHCFGLSNTPPVDGHRPAASVLLTSLAQTFAAEGIGVVLSGIGRDGVSGLRDMRAVGALTLAQSAVGCAVYGMPRAAVEASVVVRSETPAELCRLVQEVVHGTAHRSHGALG